jgi:RNA polymerase sigma factor (sigma-70 family)
MFSPERKAHTEHCFDAYCKKSMRFEARNCYRAIKRKSEREISLNYLTEEYHFELPCLDEYPLFYSVPGSVYGNEQAVTIENELLDAALSRLPGENRELILLLYFWGFKEKEVAVMYGRARSTISYHKHKSLKMLRQEMERLSHEENQIQIPAV